VYRPRRVVLNTMTIAVIAAGFALPRFPGPGEPRPAWFLPYLLAIVVQWTTTSVIAAVWFWRAGSGRPTAQRNRMRLLAVGTAALNLLILVSALRPESDPEHKNVALQLANLLTASVFFVGLAPPRQLIERWRRPEMEAARGAVAELITAVTPSDVATKTLPHMLTIIGGQSAALYAKDGTLLGFCGDVPPSGSDKDPPTAHDPLRFGLRSGGELVVRSDSSSPLFAHDSVEVLAGYVNLIDLAIARCESAAKERQFISNAAHELRTPLTTMTGLAETLAENREHMAPDQVTECLSGVVRQGRRARDLVNNLLDMAYIESGHLPFADDVLVLSDVVYGSLDAAPAPDGCHVCVDVPPDVRVRGDARRIQQVVVNLITNAYRYGGEEISIGARPEADDVVLTVTDDGAGVAPELVPTLFDPFSRAASANGSGSGLGLAICRRIVDELGGSITYEASGTGSRFKVALRKAA
jgi:anti-sigma regulatory factor (Ser/Thr protein kinase)